MTIEEQSAYVVNEISLTIDVADSRVPDSLGISRELADGIYDVTGLTTMCIEEEFRTIVYNGNVRGNVKEDVERIYNFMVTYPNWHVGSAYETSTSIFVSNKPEKINIPIYGTGFNYGATALLDNCPSSILILAEND